MARDSSAATTRRAPGMKRRGVKEQHTTSKDTGGGGGRPYPGNQEGFSTEVENPALACVVGCGKSNPIMPQKFTASSANDSTTSTKPNDSNAGPTHAEYTASLSAVPSFATAGTTPTANNEPTKPNTTTTANHDRRTHTKTPGQNTKTTHHPRIDLNESPTSRHQTAIGDRKPPPPSDAAGVHSASMYRRLPRTPAENGC